MGAGIPYVHSKGKNTTSIVMCPSHLVNKWKREIDRLVPNSETYILKDYKDIIKLEDKIKDPNKKKSLYLVVSNERAKSNYDTRPVAIWSKHRKAFVCPDCGKVLNKYEAGESVKLGPEDFARELKINERCTNLIKKWSKEENEYVDVECGSRLWAPLNKDDENIKWYKLGSSWVHEDSLELLQTTLTEKEKKTKSEKELLARVIELKVDLNNGKKVSRYFRASRKYSISTYVKENLKGKIDYLIADELHLLKGESLQGQSFDDFIKASKKTIGLTGTLLNGYADSIFYTLYRTVPNTMLEDGFRYNDVNKFIRTYGVHENISLSNGKTRTKKLPGVSPVVFTKFLLENSVFVSLSDMSDGLPNYTEIPVGVSMTEDLRKAYEIVEEGFVNNVGMFKGQGIMSTYLQLLSTFPDKPYSNEDIYDPLTGDLLSEVPSIMSYVLNQELDKSEQRIVDRDINLDSYKDNKLDEYIKIVEKKVEAGENVLTYVSWTNKTDSAERIKEALSYKGIKAEILQNVAPDKREEWIKDKLDEGMKVMICNPVLVETGLDLLDFTTIIFYQLGYNIFTMRQASRRSWRLSQDKDIEVYFLYYRRTVQEKTLSLMANKLKASMAIEGKFSEEGLRAMSDNTDLMSEIANSIIDGIKNDVDENSFSTTTIDEDSVMVQEDYKRRQLRFLTEKRFGGNHQRRPRENKIVNKMLTDPKALTNLVKWY